VGRARGRLVGVVDEVEVVEVVEVVVLLEEAEVVVVRGAGKGGDEGLVTERASSEVVMPVAAVSTPAVKTLIGTAAVGVGGEW